GVWVGLAALFAGFVYWRFGQKHAFEFVTGYLLEESLSVDNIFVIVLVFRSFRIPGKYQHRGLVWGILGAVVLLATLIIGGTALIHRFSWMEFVFGGFLVVTGIRLFFGGDDDDDKDIQSSRVVRLARKILPATETLHEERFFVRERGKLLATP